MAKKLLFSVTKKDFDIQTFRSGGKGGQHQNTTDSGVRIVHKESGAVGECRNYRSQHQNRKAAFLRLVESDTFKKWHKYKCAVMMGHEIDLEKKLAESMKPENIKVEYGPFKEG